MNLYHISVPIQQQNKFLQYTNQNDRCFKLFSATLLNGQSAQFWLSEGQQIVMCFIVTRQSMVQQICNQAKQNKTEAVAGMVQHSRLKYYKMVELGVGSYGAERRTKRRNGF